MCGLCLTCCHAIFSRCLVTKLPKQQGAISTWENKWKEIFKRSVLKVCNNNWVAIWGKIIEWGGKGEEEKFKTTFGGWFR
jgi:hypothetical protein